MNSEIEKIKKITEKIEGYIRDEEGEFLYKVAKKCNAKKGVIVEIGSWKGKSTIYLGFGSKAGTQARIYAIDPHVGTFAHKFFGTSNTFEEFRKNIQVAGVGDIIFPIVKTSSQAAETFQEPIEFLFIDGDHDYELVRLDYELWFPKLADGGLIAFHDSEDFGPRKVIERYIYKSKYFKNIGFINSILFAQKVKENSLMDKIRNRILLFVVKSAHLYHKFPFPKPVTKFREKILKIINKIMSIHLLINLLN